ncbi:MAG: hypothetical protein A3F82_01195 [Deltaproteobacteria bacterium RIFCSPLOWO2_12_FULL_44_12]|nr:MAG: hypothetical protein A2712_03760 [Deltaproteobacteria bacterium RIFCSPHIGHO2_01_FULL_43_49]OGQ16303.1 MAG: hypothetical protein A3D22_01730 [Deltaproteobacteria bacterium RIFCSPHIGHO2_02_FULL_44_53]OGQ29263.1 MAG: hypothetical protein A3D98_05515 [Deltaproteobacteria bacterium RIFCSPHIGHO2_12_FULL_44_21]OGQ32820.1 MAG: hypothetical protein A2979_09660 [Deltaproteobacteria bacterium RIFCSPLOWO2_01_FULL_45_74]OGQ41921.1 MAG: hypothetical protein A3I70_09445 [Deltaproteobacteria bacterium 
MADPRVSKCSQEGAEYFAGMGAYMLLPNAGAEAKSRAQAAADICTKETNVPHTVTTVSKSEYDGQTRLVSTYYKVIRGG